MDAAHSTSSDTSQTIYVPIASPPTPAPSPRPIPPFSFHYSTSPSSLEFAARREFASLDPSSRKQLLLSIIGDCTPSELLFISTTITPLLKRDFLHELPPELALHVLSFIDDPRTLARAGQVSRPWNALVNDEYLWKRLCDVYQFEIDRESSPPTSAVSPKAPPNDGSDADEDDPLEEMEPFANLPMDPALQWLTDRRRRARREQFRVAAAAAHTADSTFSFRKHFKASYQTMMNWRRGGRLLRVHRVPFSTPDNGVVTSVALDKDWLVVGLANCKIHVFSARSGVLSRTLIGHESGVWAVHLVSKGGWRNVEAENRYGLLRRKATNTAESNGTATTTTTTTMTTTTTTTTAHASGTGVRIRHGRSHSESFAYNFSSDVPISENWTGSLPSCLDHLVPPSSRAALGLNSHNLGAPPPPPPSPEDEGNEPIFEDDDDVGKPSDLCGASEGWGQPNALIVSGGCDKMLRVWDVKSGYCLYALGGHTGTIRCLKVLHNRPIAVTGSRDGTLRVWDVQLGAALRVLEGHRQSVRCLDVCGNKVVSGSYDATCRIWNVDTGRCLHVLQGHVNQVYSVAFDGIRVASGGLDTTVRVWDARTGDRLAVLQGHTALVCQLQLSPTILATGGSDGRVITFSLTTFEALHRIAAHDSSVTSLQFDARFLVTGGNDGRVRLFETDTGNYIRELREPCDCIWKVVFRKATCAIMCKRAGKTVMEIWSYGCKGE